MALERFKAAPLPNPPAQYDPQYVRQLIRVLEIYFNQLDSITPNQAQSYRADNFYGGTLDGIFAARQVTTTQKNALTPQAGWVVFDTTLGKLSVYNGTNWQTITST
jgi:hypothetical protein